MNDRPMIHAVMYRDYKIGTLCDSSAWGPAVLHSTVTDEVTCPGCRTKIDGGRLPDAVPSGVVPSAALHELAEKYAGAAEALKGHSRSTGKRTVYLRVAADLNDLLGASA